jgi:ketosteroid isomerase-like protein
MKSTSLVTILVFVAGLGIGYFARSAGIGTPKKADTHAADLAAIERLDKADIAATLTQDPTALTTLWSEDAVNLGFPGPPVVGIKAMGEANQKFRTDYPEFKVLKYAPDIKDVQIADGWAIEVGNFAGTYKISAKGDPVSTEGKGMRVLKRQNDGSWKFALVGLK